VDASHENIPSSGPDCAVCRGGFIALSAYSLYVVRDAMLSERKAGIETHVRMAGNLIAQFQAAEKAGKLSREEAQRQAAQAIRGMRHKGDYMVLRDYSGLFIAHPDKRKEGKIDPGGKLPDGRTTIEGYARCWKKATLAMCCFTPADRTAMCNTPG